MAEEVERPARDIPIGVSGSVVIVTVLYCLMAASMSMLLPYDAVRTKSRHRLEYLLTRISSIFVEKY
jgi:amino acid transporter